MKVNVGISEQEIQEILEEKTFANARNAADHNQRMKICRTETLMCLIAT